MGGEGTTEPMEADGARRQAARALTVRYGTLSLLQELAIALPMPVLVVHMTGRGLALDTIGLAFALRSATVVALELPTGGLADAIGRKTTALLSQAFTLASFVALLWLTSPLLALLYALLQGIGAALHSGALEAWYVERLRSVHRGVDLQQNLAVIGSLQSTGMLLGTALGGFLPGWAAPLHLPFPLSGFAVALAASLAMRAVVWLLTVVLVDEPAAAGRASLAGIGSIPAIVMDAATLARRSKVVPYLVLASVGSGVAMIGIETFWQPIASHRLGADAAHSSVFGIFGVLMGAAALAGGVLVARFGRRLSGNPAALAAGTMATRGLGLLLFATASSPVGLAAAFVFVYLGIGASQAPHDALLHAAVPDERRSTMLSINSLALFAGLGLGSGLLGWLASATSPGLALGLAAAAALGASGAYLAVGRARAVAGPAVTEPAAD